MNLDKKSTYAVISAFILVIITSIYFIVYSLTPMVEYPMRGMMGGMMGHNQQIYRPWYTTLIPILTLTSSVIVIVYILSFNNPPKKEQNQTPIDQSETEKSFLDIIPDDEKAVLDPILKYPGLGQTEVVQHSNFSKAKVSQVLSELEKRGVIYRVKEGRMFRVYPSEKLNKSVMNNGEHK